MNTLQSTVSQLFGWKYKFNSATSGDPGTGKFWFDNATIASATSFRIYKTDADGNDLSNWTDVWDDGSGSPRAYVTIRKVADKTAFVVFGITSDDAGGLVNYRTYSILVAASGGTFSNDDECTVTWVPSGKTTEKHYALLARTGTAITLPSGGSASSLTNIPMDTDQGSVGMTINTADARPITIGRTGLYKISHSIAGQIGAGDLLATYVLKNGATSSDVLEAGITRVEVGTTDVITCEKSFFALLSAGDTIGLYAFQDGASNRTTNTAAGNRPILQVVEQ